MPTDYMQYAVAAIVTVIAVARVTKLITEDTWPPAQWGRDRWFDMFGPTSGWRELVICPFCTAPYVAAIDLAVAYFTDMHPIWWAVNIWLAVSYLAAIVVARDIPAEDR